MISDELLHAILDVERAYLNRRHLPGAKDQHVSDTLGLSPTRYHQLLNAVVDDCRALEADPVLVRLLRERRDAGLKSRSRRLRKTEMASGSALP